MQVELGHYALMLALLLSVAQAFFGLAGPALGRERWLAAAPSAAAGQFVFLALAAGVLINAFVQNDFSVRYVAENSNSALPLFYRVTALWGAHEGSLLLWILVLAGWTVAVVARMRFLPAPFVARVLGVLQSLADAGVSVWQYTTREFVRLDGENVLLSAFKAYGNRAEALKASSRIRVSKPRSRRSCAAVRACDRYASSAQAFERRTTQIVPLRLKPYGDVLRQLNRNLHGCRPLLSIVSGATLFGHSDRRRIQHWRMCKGSVCSGTGF